MVYDRQIHSFQPGLYNNLMIYDHPLFLSEHDLYNNLMIYDNLKIIMISPASKILVEDQIIVENK